MPDGLNTALDETEETFDDLVERLECTTRDLGKSVETLAGHMAEVTKAILMLKPAEAVAETAEAVKDAAEGAGEIVGDAAEAAGQAAATPVAVIEDAADNTAKVVEHAPATILRRNRLKRGRR